MANDLSHVIVVGAGPVGLALACELRRYGVDCRIVDAESGPTPLLESRALVIQARTLELLDHLDLALPLISRGRPIHALTLHDRGRKLCRLELDFDHLATPYPFVLVLEQAQTERVLIDKLRDLGTQVEWQTRLETLRQDDRGVTATLVGPAAKRELVQCHWLAGCDGARSTVREQLGLPFHGAAYATQIQLADVKLSWHLEQNGDQIFLVRGRPVVAIPLRAKDHWRLIDPTGQATNDSREAIITRFQDLLAHGGFPDAHIQECFWTSSFRLHRRATRRLRVGRCFLAGDAAHIHSPVGGQGMNKGIQEAMNLGWKLGLVATGRGPESLLDSYEVERFAVSQRIQLGTHIATQVALAGSHLGRGLRNALVPWAQNSRLLRRMVTTMMSQLGAYYVRSPIVGESWPSSAKKKGLRPGERVPDMPIRLGCSEHRPGRLLELFKTSRHHVFYFVARAAQSDCEADFAKIAWEIDLQFTRNAFRHWLIVPAQKFRTTSPWTHGRVYDDDSHLALRFGVDAPSVFVLRPDGHVAFRSMPPSLPDLVVAMKRILLPS